MPANYYDLKQLEEHNKQNNMIKISLNFSQFCDNWPESRKNQFSYYGKKAIFEYLEEYSEESGQDIEFDPIAICCEYIEYCDLEELQGDYPDISSMEELEEKTTVIKTEDGDRFVILQF